MAGIVTQEIGQTAFLLNLAVINNQGADLYRGQQAFAKDVRVPPLPRQGDLVEFSINGTPYQNTIKIFKLSYSLNGSNNLSCDIQILAQAT